jgi:formate hydrogenlyase subunit 3/multisubunit Na+/H+ antiporter MnhD subunit
MHIAAGIILVTVFFSLLAILVNERLKGIVALAAVLVNAALSSYIAAGVLAGLPYEKVFYGGYVLGEIPVRIDALGAWFILVMNFTSVTGILYGRSYMKRYTHQPANLSIHYISYILIHFSMMGIYCVQNSLAFLCVWEMMAICSFLLVIFEHRKPETIRAGINYLVQSHIGIVFLTIGFIWVSSHTGSYDFTAIGDYSATISPSLRFLLFLSFFVPFAIKAGFVPFHTWLPYAHPAAPSHVSGIMSGVIIKLGIFGILKMLLLIRGNYLVMGNVILIVSVVSGIYGVMLATVQHNVKKLLAYHSIENIGIIGMGIGLGAIGLGLSNSWLAFAGFAGALLHTFNHSLFKSLLFYAAGSVYQATHTMEIERLGGLIKKMPQTAALFLVAALAICGLPPFNGFISEFLIYSGLFNGINSNHLPTTVLMISSIFGLVIIGGLAMLCFTKAFGIIFLGNERQPHHEPIKEADFFKLFPKYLVVIFIVAVGVVPQLFITVLAKPVSLFTGGSVTNGGALLFSETLQSVSLAVWGFIVLVLVLIRLRKFLAREISVQPTWGCGYVTPGAKMQYTANSFVRSYRKLAKPLLLLHKKESVISQVFPAPFHFHSQPYDKLEAFLIDIPLKRLRNFINKFRFLQNGSPRFYVLYGVIFIILVIMFPLAIDAVNYLIGLFRQI